VRVAAPIAMVGYYLVDADFHHDLGERERRHPDRAAAHVRLRHPGPGPPDSHRRRDHRDLPDGSTATPCPGSAPASSPFAYSQQAEEWCFSKVNGLGSTNTLVSPDLNGHTGFGVPWEFPMLIAAVDPAAEAKLDGLNHAVTSGGYSGRQAPYRSARRSAR